MVTRPQRCGLVTIIGRPNTGKSTLLNCIVGEKVAIVSQVPQTTRNQIRGIYNDGRGQIVFIDTPGLHIGRDKLDKFMNKSSVGTIHDADAVVYLVDTSRRTGPEEEYAAGQLASVDIPVVLGLNKIDLKGKYVPDYIALLEKAKGKPVQQMQNVTLLPLSGKAGTNTEKLLDIIFEYLPQGPALYPEDIICDVPQRLAVADIIREKLFELMKEEIPHALTVVVEHMQPRAGKTTHIKALILVERETQKEIVIGKGGRVLKEAGTLARKELEALLETKVFLELFVKVQKQWRNDDSLLQELGYEKP
ncbi:MAG: GTPase Era [Candidatus Omnitrophica bacterium]|nr:GTPase Era [Candidatus Omnitrophota bacterium]